MNHEQNIHNILGSWSTPGLKTDLTEHILAKLDTHHNKGKRFKFAWVAMVVVIFMNVAVTVSILKEDREYRTNIYKNYFETTRQELVNDDITE